MMEILLKATIFYSSCFLATVLMGVILNYFMTSEKEKRMED